MRPSNPATYFVTGSDWEAFTHGSTVPAICPYYATVRAKHHIPLSLLLFAHNEPHVRSILGELVTFAEACSAKRAADRRRHGDIDKHGIDQAHARQIKILKDALAGTSKEYKLTITPAPTDQLYKVGWASNDTIL